MTETSDYVPGTSSLLFDDAASNFDVTTERVYSLLPEVFRKVDAIQTIPSAGSPLKRFLRGICGVQDDIEVLIARFNYLSPDERITGTLNQDHVTYARRVNLPGSLPIGETSDLADPVSADVTWLPWLAQLVGARLDNLYTEEEKRDAVKYASAGFRAGSKQSIIDAARSELTGTKHVDVFPHSISNPGDGTEWDVMLVTSISETPVGIDLVETLIRKGVKPAGVVLHHRSFETVWDEIETALPLWIDWENAGSWRAIEETGL